MAGMIFSEGSGLQDSVFLKSQAPIRMFIEKRGEAEEAKSCLPELFSMTQSRHWGEKFTSMTAMSGFQPVGEGGAYPVDGMEEGYNKFMEHISWKNSFMMTKEIVDDAKLLDLKNRPASFVTSYYRTRERFGAALYAAAALGSTSTSFEGHPVDTTAADGRALFATNHPGKVSKKNQSNKFTDAFSTAALGALETAMQNFRGDNDELLAVAPDTIVIPNDYALKKAVFEAIGSDKDPATSNNGFNYHFGRWNVIVWPYLNGILTGNSKPWILIDSNYNEQYGGAVWLDREPLTIRSTIDDGTDNNVWRGRARFIAGFVDWRFAAIGGAPNGSTLISS